MKRARFLLISFAIFAAALSLSAQPAEDPNARPPVTKTDIEIVKRAAQILNSPAKWNRADNRVCPEGAKTFSLYCALEKATQEVTKNFEHRGAAMQEARFVIEEIAPQANSYDHRLMGYNNDPSTTFTDIQGVFWLLEKHVAMRLAQQQSAVAELEVARRVRQILDSPAKWNRTDTPCAANATTFNLLCAFEKAEKEVAGASVDGAAITEARAMINQLDPGHTKYKARLVDYNADPAITFQDLQAFLRQLEDRLAARLPAK